MNFWIISIPLFLVLVQQSSQLNISSKDKLTVTFKFYCPDDSGAYYEPYGSLDVQIAGGQKHTIYDVKKIDARSNEIRNGVSKSLTQDIPIPARTSDKDEVTLTGKMMEDDNVRDDVIGDYDDTKIKIGEIESTGWERTFDGDDGCYVDISIY